MVWFQETIMILSAKLDALLLADWASNIIDYQVLKGNQLWRFGLLLVIILVTLAVGKIVQFTLINLAKRTEQRKGRVDTVAIFINCLSKPASVAIFAVGLWICHFFLVFSKPGIPEQNIMPTIGIAPEIGLYWAKIATAIAAIAFAYAAYRLVDLIEYYLLRWTSATKTKLDDMLVPIVRKSLRITIAIIAALWIADGILGANVRAILLSAGVGGIAVALAAKDSIANFFGSITIFADRPFQVDELVKIDGHLGPVTEVGFRSTKINTLQGHLITVPNSVIANSIVENVGRRPFIRRTSNITITYDSTHKKAQRAVDIIKDILAQTPEVNSDPDHTPRVYFNDFNDWSLNIYMTYWVKPPDYWLYQDVNQRVNLEMMKRFEDEEIEFAFPTQTLYMKKESADDD